MTKKDKLYIKNPIVDIKEIINQSFERYYNNLTPNQKIWFDAAANAKNISGYDFYLFLLANDELSIPSAISLS